MIEAIEALEQEFGVTVMAASQACVWDALRLVGVDDAIQATAGCFGNASRAGSSNVVSRRPAPTRLIRFETVFEQARQ